MARRSSVISVLITGDNSQLSGALNESSSRIGDFGKKAGIALAAVGAAVGAAAFTIGRRAVDAASDLEESINAVNVTFNEAAEGIQNLASEAATAVGLSSREFNAFAVQFAGFTSQIAGSEGDIVDVTDELTRRIADFASVMNLEVSEAAQVFQSSLAGQTEPIRRFGIDLSAAAVGLHAVETGLVDSASEMTESDKVMARYSLLMSETSQMAGDFANTSDGLANSQRILKARVDDTMTALGAALLPVVTNLVGIVGDKLVPAFERFAEWFQRNEGTITEFGERVLGGIETAVGFVGDKFGEWRPKIDEAVSFVRTKTGEFRTFFDERVRQPVDTALERIQTFATEAKTAISGFVSDLEPSFQGFLDFFRNLNFDDPEQLGRDLGEALSGAVRNALESLATLTGEINDLIGRLFDGVDWFDVGKRQVANLAIFALGFATSLLNFDWLMPVISAIRDNLGEVLLAAVGLALLPAKIAGGIAKVLAKIPLVGRFLSWAVGALNRMGAGIRDRVGLIFSSFRDGFLAAIRGGGPRLVTQFTDFLLAFPRALVRMFDDLTVNVGTGFFRFGSSIGTAIRNVIARIRDFLSTLMRPFTNFGRMLTDDLFALGRNAMDALARGIRRAGSAVFNAAKDVARRAWDAVSSLWRISSPSRVFMDIGHDAMEGLALGIKDAERMVTGATSGVALNAIPTIDTTGRPGAGSGQTVINVTVTSADPQAVVEALRRYTRNNGPLGQVVSV
ncbi:MAG TPA: hypothetical protein VIG24_15025 [Acidimicrobiia bacterium]